MARSKKILEGPMKELKRRYAQDLLRLSIDASLADVTALPGVATAKSVDGTYIVSLTPGTDRREFLRRTMERIGSRRSRRRSPSSKRSTSTPCAPPASKRPERSREATMNWKKIFAIVRREYVERVRTKAFWFSTLIIPIFFLGYVGVQISASRKTGGERHLVVVDPSGALAQPLTRELAAVEAEQKEKQTETKGPHWVVTR
jgi:hypothetical protein